MEKYWCVNIQPWGNILLFILVENKRSSTLIVNYIGTQNITSAEFYTIPSYLRDMLLYCSDGGGGGGGNGDDVGVKYNL